MIHKLKKIVQKKYLLTAIKIVCAVALFGQERAPLVTLKTPYNTVYAHSYYLSADNYSPSLAAKTLYLPNEEPSKSVEFAIKIKEVLDGRGLILDFTKIPNTDDYTDSTSNRTRYVLFSERLPELYLERISGRWYFSPESVEAIQGIYSRMYPFGSNILRQSVPKWAKNSFLSIEIWQYLGVLFIFLFTMLLYLGLGKLSHLFVHRVASPMADRIKVSVRPELPYEIARALVFVILTFIIGWFIPSLLLPVEINSWIFFFLLIGRTVFIVTLLLRFWEIGILLLRQVFEQFLGSFASQILPITQRIVQAAPNDDHAQRVSRLSCVAGV